MFCIKCGKVIPDGSTKCPECGADLSNKADENNSLKDNNEQSDTPTVVYASTVEDIGNNPINVPGDSSTDTESQKSSHRAGLLKRIGCFLGIVVIVIAAVRGFNYYQAYQLNKVLQKEWNNTSGSVLLRLDFDGHNVTYRIDSVVGVTGFSGKYKTISANQIKVDAFGYGYHTYTVDFNDNKTIMTISPALTSTDSSEVWYDLN